MSHSLYAPSGASLWTKCLKSLDKPDENDDRVESDKGTVAHKIGEKCILFGFAPSDYLGDTIDNVTIDDTVVSNVNLYVNYIKGLSVNYGVKPIIEKHVTMTSIADSGVVHGTFDCGFLVNRKLHILDYKNGFVLVEIENNLQFIMYCIGYLDENVLWNDIDEIETTVIQPNGFHSSGPVRSFKYSVDYLKQMSAWLKYRVNQHLTGDYTFEAGSHCTYCHRAPRCKANYLQQVGITFDDDELTDDELIIRHSLSKATKKNIEAISDEVYKLAKRGKPIDGFKIVESRSRQAVNDEHKFVNDAITDGVDINDLYKFTLKTKNQLKNVVNQELLDHHFSSEKTGDTLVPMSDPRRAVSGLTAFNTDDIKSGVTATKPDPVSAFKDFKL